MRIFFVLRTHRSEQTGVLLLPRLICGSIIIFWEKDRIGIKKLKVAANYLLLDCCTVLHSSITEPIKYLSIWNINPLYVSHCIPHLLFPYGAVINI